MMRENSIKKNITRGSGVLNKVMIIDEWPVFSHGLALSLNARECTALHSHYNSTENTLTEIEDGEYDAVFIGYSGAQDQKNVHAVTTALRFKNTPVFIMSEEKHYKEIMPLITHRCKILLRSECPERILQEVMSANYVNSYEVNGALSTDPMSTPSTPLTHAEKQVLSEMLKGYSLTEIAKRFSKSVKTISAQKQTAIKRLGVRNTQELYLFLTTARGKNLIR